MGHSENSCEKGELCLKLGKIRLDILWIRTRIDDAIYRAGHGWKTEPILTMKNKTTETIKHESIQVEELFGGKLVKVIASGKLSRDSYDFFTPELDSLIERNGKIRLLFEMIHFEGWTLGAAWEDLKFSCKHFSDIERIAVVGNKKWEKAMVVVCKPFTKAKIRYFDISEIGLANDWVAEGF